MDSFGFRKTLEKDMVPNVQVLENGDEILVLAQPVLDSIAMLLGTASTRYHVVVHSDKNGPKDRVFSLSEQRAAAIVAYLNRKGISEERLKPVGAGWKCFLGNESDPEDLMRNRRVEFIRMGI